MAFLNIDNENQFQLETQKFIGRSIGVLGITGSGKTNTAAVLIEELLANNFPLTIVDIEGEYWGLKERFEILVVGRSANADIEVNTEHAEQLAEVSVTRGISVILDMSDFSQSEMFDFLLNYFRALWTVCSTVKRPYVVVLEEAHEFIPQGVRTDLKEVLTRIALRGRKRGLGIILISQRSAKVEKDVLTQTWMLFLHRVIHPVDLKVYKDLIPLQSREVEDMVGGLQSGQVIILNDHIAKVAQIRLRHTLHVGATPSLAVTKIPNLRKINKNVLEELRKLTTTKNKDESNNEQAQTLRRLKELEEIIAQKDSEIERLQTQIAILSNIKLSIDGLAANSHLPNRISKLEIEQAAIQNLVSNEKIKEAPPETTVAIMPKLSYNDEHIRALTTSKQQKLDAIIRRIHKLPKLERSILRLLMEHDGVAMTVPMMASWLGVKETTIRSNPPFDLLKMKLISRTYSREGYRYISRMTTFLQVEFPDIDLTDLLIRLN